MTRQYDFVYTLGADFKRDIWLKSGADADVRGAALLLELRHPVTNALLLKASTDHVQTPNARILAGYGVITVHIEDSVTIDKSGLPVGYVTEPVPSLDNATTVYGAYCIFGLSIEQFDGTVLEMLRGKIGFRQLIAQI